MTPALCSSPLAQDNRGNMEIVQDPFKLLAEIELQLNKKITPAIHNYELPCTEGEPTTCPFYPEPRYNNQKNKNRITTI
jgi:hypothetical protein